MFDKKVVKSKQIDSRVKMSWADHPEGLRAEHLIQGPSATKEEALKEAPTKEEALKEGLKEATG